MNNSILEIRNSILNSSKESKIYIGSDSKRIYYKNIWWSIYSTVVVIHVDSNHGCKILGYMEKERDIDSNKSRPINRMLHEAYLAGKLYLELKDIILTREVEIHLDINPSKKYGSEIAFEQARAYIKSLTNKNPITKPFAFAASKAADRFSSI